MKESFQDISKHHGSHLNRPGLRFSVTELMTIVIASYQCVGNSPTPIGALVSLTAVDINYRGKKYLEHQRTRNAPPSWMDPMLRAPQSESSQHRPRQE